MCTFVHVIYVLFGDNKGNKKGWNPSEGFSLISFRAKNFYRTAIIFISPFSNFSFGLILAVILFNLLVDVVLQGFPLDDFHLIEHSHEEASGSFVVADR